MHRYVIERDLQDVGNLSAEQLEQTKTISNIALQETGGVQWVESFVTQNRIYCSVFPVKVPEKKPTKAPPKKPSKAPAKKPAKKSPGKGKK